MRKTESFRGDHASLADHPFSSSPEDLHELRATVEDWLNKARQAVWSFEDETTGCFRKDSSQPPSASITTTARCYMGLAYAERQRGKEKEDSKDWRGALGRGLNYLNVKQSDSGRGLELLVREPQPLNNFELAHYVDFYFAREFCARFGSVEMPKWPEGLQNVDVDHVLSEMLRGMLLNVDGSKEGQIYFDTGQDESRHFFVTLHVLRALTVLRCEDDPRYPTLWMQQDNSALINAFTIIAIFGIIKTPPD